MTNRQTHTVTPAAWAREQAQLQHAARIGYIQIRSFDQNAERQPEGVEFARMFTDQASGKYT